MREPLLLFGGILIIVAIVSTFVVVISGILKKKINKKDLFRIFIVGIVGIVMISLNSWIYKINHGCYPSEMGKDGICLDYKK